MKSIEEYVVAYRETVQAAVPNEQVLCVGVLSRPGGMSRALLSNISPVAGMVKNHEGKNASGKLPMNVAVAATPTRVLFFDYKPRMTAIKLKKLVREISRTGLAVTAEPGTIATRVTFHVGDGSTFELDSNRSIGQYNRLNDWLLAELSR